MSEQNHSSHELGKEDKLSTPLKVVSFCIPIAGAIIYFTSKDKMPLKAKSACHSALWGLGIGILLNILMVVFGGALGLEELQGLE